MPRLEIEMFVCKSFTDRRSGYPSIDVNIEAPCRQALLSANTISQKWLW